MQQRRTSATEHALLVALAALILTISISAPV